MHESESQWYYTSGTERQGPVDRVTLTALARSGRIDPRMDLVWAPGMADWIPAGKVEGLYEMRAVAVAPTPTVAQTMAVAANYDDRPMARASHEGLGRLGYFFGTLLLPLLMMIGIGMALELAKPVLGEQLAGTLSLLILLVPVVVILLTVKRLHNLAMSGWWWLGMLVPFLNVWLSYRCFACPPGYAVVRKLDGIGVVLAIVFWLTQLAGLVVVVLLLMAGWNEYQKSGNWDEAIRKLRENYESMEMRRPPHY